MENSFYQNRLESVRKIMDLNHLDGILFSTLENIRYLCGFTGSDGAFVITQMESFFLTDSRYWIQSEEEVKESHIIHYKKKWEGISSLLLALELRKIGFESTSFPFSAHQFLIERLPPEAKLVPLEDEIKNIRPIKEV